MGKPSLNIENNHPAFAENHKKNSKKTKSRKIQKKWNVFWYQKEDKEKTKNNRRLKKKIIDKSRRNKRQLKNTELEIKTPQQERDAYDEVEAEYYAYLVETYDHMMKVMKDPIWYIEVSTSSEGDERPWVCFKLKRQCVELCDDGDMEPV